MPDYGYYGGGTKPSKRRPGKSGGSARRLARQGASGEAGGARRVPFAVRTIDAVVMVLTLVCTVLLVCAYIARYVDPRSAVFFAFAGLGFPLLYVGELVVGLYWVVRWMKPLAISVGVVLLLGLGSVGLFFRPAFSNDMRDSKPSSSDQVVMSYNVMNFSHRLDTGKKNTIRDISEFVAGSNVDLLCVQEHYEHPDFDHIFDDNLSAMPNKYFRYYDETASTQDGASGMAIYSRYPIVARGAVEPGEGDRLFCIWVDVKIKRDTVRVINNHLRSTYLKDTDVDFLSGLDAVAVDSVGKLRGIVATLSESYRVRAAQADAVTSFVTTSPHRVILCGDFNDTPQSYAYHTIADGLSDSYARHGRGAGGTYVGFSNIFRIDYIMTSRGVVSTSYHSADVAYSDHRPVFASFELVDKE